MKAVPLTPRQRELNEEAERRVKKREAHKLRLVVEADPRVRRFARRFGDSELDAARTLGIRCEAAPLLPGLCRQCHGLAHRRPEDGSACHGCGGHFELERFESPEPQGYSSICGFASW